jgi:hypothetical protein
MSKTKQKRFQDFNEIRSDLMTIFPFKSMTCIFILLSLFHAHLLANVRLDQQGQGWELKLNGRPFPIRGVTYSNKYDAKSIDADMRRLKKLGVNVIRTWGTGDESKVLFDAAHRQGIKVMAGIWMRHGRPGAEGDDFFNWLTDHKGMQDQWDLAIKTVKQYKKHPAILFWGVGNEVYLNIATEKEKIAYSKFLGRLCQEIKRIDPKTLISSSGAWTIPVAYWEKYCPDIDVYGVNSYGAGVGALQSELRKLGVTKPYVLTEFGPRGEWDAPADKNGLKVEPSDEEKWHAHADGWKEWIEEKEQCIGGFAFNYGNVAGFNHAEIWLNLKVQNCFRPQYWATYQTFTGKKPPHAFPKFKKYSIPKDIGYRHHWVDVDLDIEDRDSKKFEVSFYYNQRLEGGARHKRDAVMPLEFRGNMKDGFQFKTPNELGLLKVYAFVKDQTKNLAIAQTSYVIVADDQDLGVGKAGKSASLPFYVYKDDGHPDNHYGATGFMGSDTSKLKIDHKHQDDHKEGSSCMAITYEAQGGWYGLSWQDPFGDWGEKYGGYDLREAKTLSFWVKADQPHVKIKFGIGMFNRGKSPWFDTALADTGDMELPMKWKKVEMDISKLDLTRVKTGFYFFGGGMGKNYRFYIDEIKFY